MLRVLERHTPGLTVIHRALAVAICMVAIFLMAPGTAKAANQITLTGSVAQNCTITVNADPNAASLNLTGGATHVQIGTVVQNCNKKAGYNVVLTSTNCSTSPTGAKLLGGVSGDTLPYSVESTNPVTGGSSADVVGLLASVCTGQNGRVVTNAKITGETSTIFANYTGSSGLSADTYTDTLTFTMNVN